METAIPPSECQVGFAVRKAPSAVLRNRVRRLMRESWRQGRHALAAACAAHDIRMTCVFLYDFRRAGQAPSFADVDERMRCLLRTIEESIVKA